MRLDHLHEGGGGIHAAAEAVGLPADGGVEAAGGGVGEHALKLGAALGPAAPNLLVAGGYGVAAFLAVGLHVAELLGDRGLVFLGLALVGDARVDGSATCPGEMMVRSRHGCLLECKGPRLPAGTGLGVAACGSHRLYPRRRGGQTPLPPFAFSLQAFPALPLTHGGASTTRVLEEDGGDSAKASLSVRLGPVFDGDHAPSTAFLVRNPAQTSRALRPAEGVRDGGVTVIAAADPRRGLDDALRDIESQEGNHGPPISVLVLGRYRSAREALPTRRPGRLRVEFSTVHAAKGREADYVVVLDLRDARRGFPSQLEDDPLLEIVLPRPPGGEYPHAEERRLFYVAMTRARFGAYLVADALRPSPFVEELRRQSPGLRQLGEFRRDRKPACPRCHTGRLDELASGSALYCLNFPFCRYRAPRCPTCGGGFAVRAGDVSRCTSASCDASLPVCDSCGAGVMVVRNGRNGRFLRCSEYASDQPCRNTHNLPSRR